MIVLIENVSLVHQFALNVLHSPFVFLVKVIFIYSAIIHVLQAVPKLTSLIQLLLLIIHALYVEHLIVIFARLAMIYFALLAKVDII